MKCKITTTTKQTEDHGISLFDSAFFGNEPMLEDDYDELEESQIDTITTYFEGEMADTGDDVRITYHETGFDGSDSVDVVVAYKKSCPEEVVITRSGAISTVMLFALGQRTISVYTTPFAPFELGIYAQRLDNRLDTEGVLEILYLVEIKGALAQKTELKLEVKPL